MEILIISGLSGSGKSRAATFLEDIGYYIVDNLPAEMMLKFANFCTASGGRYDRVALVYDVRAGEPFQRLIDVLDKLRRRDGVRCHMLFLETDTRVIISRYKETRRSHPLCAEGISIEEAVRRERELLAPVREYVFASEAAGRFLERLEPLLAFLLPQYLQEGRTELVIAVGCTGGRHRSTAMAHHLATYIGGLGYPVSESHRDISR